MMSAGSRRWLAWAALAAGIAFAVTPTSIAKEPLSAELGVKQLAVDLEYLKAGLAKKSKNSIKPLKSVAMTIALNAQNLAQGDKAEAMAGTRDAAIKIATVLSKEEPDWDKAAKEFEGIAGAKGDGKAKIKFDEAAGFDLQELMTVFKPKNRGGRGLENTLQEQVKAAKDAKAIGELAQSIALLLTGTMDLGPNAKKWTAHAQDMQKAGAELADEAAKGAKADKATLTKLLKAVELNCTNCHKDFRK